MDIKEAAGALHALAEALSRAAEPEPINFQELTEGQRLALEGVFNQFLELKIDGLQRTVYDLQRTVYDHDKILDKVNEVDFETLSDVDGRVDDLECKVNDLHGIEEKVNDMEQKIENLEDFDAETVNRHVGKWEDLDPDDVQEAVNFCDQFKGHVNELKAILDMVKTIHESTMMKSAP